MMGPDMDKIVSHCVKSRKYVLTAARACDGESIAVAVLCSLKGAKLRGNPAKQYNNCNRENEARYSANGRFGHGLVGLVMVALLEQLDWLQGANIACYKTEDCNSNAALYQNAEVRQLQQHRGCFTRR